MFDDKMTDSFEEFAENEINNAELAIIKIMDNSTKNIPLRFTHKRIFTPIKL